MYSEKIHTEEYKGFIITVYALEEDMPLEETFNTEYFDIKQLYKDIENYKAVYFCAKVTASLPLDDIKYAGYAKMREDIVLSTEYLGACYYSSYEEFIKSCDYYHDMRETVVSEALITLHDLCKIHEHMIKSENG